MNSNQLLLAIPNYGDRCYLEQCIDQLLTYPEEFHQLKLLLISKRTDSQSLPVCEAYAEKYDNISCSRQEGRLGVVELSPIRLFEPTTAFFEKIFQKYPENLPDCFSGLFLQDIFWKFREGLLWPYHYKPEALAQAKERIIALLNQIPNERIMAHPCANNYEKLYWIRQKTNTILMPYVAPGNISLYCQMEKLHSRQTMEFVITRTAATAGRFRIMGYFKSSVFPFAGDLKFYAVHNHQKEALSAIFAPSSYFKAKELTQSFWAIDYQIAITEATTLSFQVCIDSISCKTVLLPTTQTVFAHTTHYAAGNLEITFTKKHIRIVPCSDESMRTICGQRKEILRNDYPEVCELLDCFQPGNRRIWLYYDSYSVTRDNGCEQFLHDLSKEDGIERYYVLASEYYKDQNIFDEDTLAQHTVQFRSREHKLLFLGCEKIITSFIETENLWPFPANERPAMLEYFHAQIYYLQHGVLHAHFPWYYSPLRIDIDRVVVSSQFEIENFSKNYGFSKDQLLPFGMARYDSLHPDSHPQKKIIFAPSWRSYLLGGLVAADEAREQDDTLILNSAYYQNILAFVTNPQLLEVLREQQLTLELKLHPEFYTSYRHLVTFENETVRLAANKVNLEDYAAFITDFSSFVFDYAYLKRPILYFVPDYEEFICGVNHYRELDLPYENAFGPLSTTPQEAAEQLIAVIHRQFQPEPIYAERMENFYLPMENCCEKLYQYMIKEPV